MKLEQAMKIINSEHDWREAYGFRVSFEHRKSGTIAGASFPEHAAKHPEPPIDDLQDALILANQFAQRVDPEEFVNIHVVYARGFSHVEVPANVVYNIYPAKND